MEIVHIAAGDYPKYEALLLQRDRLKKRLCIIAVHTYASSAI